MTDKNRPEPVFSAVLTPNRSLSQRGFAILMAVIASVSFVTGVAFVSMGAWPVSGFFGLDVALLYWAFRKNFSDAERCEVIIVSENELVVRQMMQGKITRESRFARSWVRTVLDIDEVRELVGPLLLLYRGKALEIGSFLNGDERKSFHNALKQALSRPNI